MAEKEKNLKKTEMIYEGKAKKLYLLDGKSNKLLQEFKDDATAFNALKKGTIENKGVINNNLTAYIFKYLEKHGVKTHFVKKVSDNEIYILSRDIAKKIEESLTYPGQIKVTVIREIRAVEYAK